MTGNTKVWRAPLAGLASLAMLATMGVAAGTANAAVAPLASEHESYADAIAAATNTTYTKALLAAGDRTTTFGGWLVDGQSVALTGISNGKESITEQRTNDVNKSGANGKPSAVRVHFVENNPDAASAAAADLGYVVVPVSANGETLTATVQPGQLPYDAADGFALDLSKVSVAGKTVDLSKGGTFDFTEADLDTNKTIQATVGGSPAWKLTFNQDSNFTGGITYPGAKADGNPSYYKQDGSVDFATNDTQYTVDVPKVPGTFDPQQVIDRATVNVSNKAIEYFAFSGGTKHTASNVIAKDASVDAHLSAAVTLTFYVDGKEYAKRSIFEGSQLPQSQIPADPSRTDGSIFTGWYVSTDTKYDDKVDTKANFDAKFNTDTILVAGWANGGSHTLTYKFADGKTADKTETYVAKQNTARPADPTREGYIFGGWYADLNNDGVLSASELTTAPNFYPDGFKFGQELTANVTLIARWLQADDATLEAALRYVNGSDESNNKDQYDGLFTAASFKEYVATYQGVQKKYADAKNAATAKGEQIPADTFSSLLNELVAGWKKLEFVHTGELTKADAIVHRLSKGNDHFYTQDSNELKGLTNKDFTGVWNDEGELFQTVPKADKPEFYSSLSDFTTAARNNADVVKTLNSVADPILTKVTRLYNRVNGDHVWSVDQNEVDYLSAQAAWNNEATAFFVPTYTGSQPVTRLAKGARHLLSTDANEVKVLTADGWGNEGVAFKAY